MQRGSRKTHCHRKTDQPEPQTIFLGHAVETDGLVIVHVVVVVVVEEDPHTASPLLGWTPNQA